MIVTCVNVYVKPDHIDDFIEASRKNHIGSVAEPGNLRFDILQHTGDPSRFMLYEVYQSPEAVSAHKETTHYSEWREMVAPWMVIPREGIPYRVICPEDANEW